MIRQQHRVRAVVDHIFRQMSDAITEQERAHLAAQPVGQLPALGKQLEADLSQLAGLLLDKDPDVSALIHAPVPFT